MHFLESYLTWDAINHSYLQKLNFSSMVCSFTSQVSFGSPRFSLKPFWNEFRKKQYLGRSCISQKKVFIPIVCKQIWNWKIFFHGILQASFLIVKALYQCFQMIYILFLNTFQKFTIRSKSFELKPMGAKIHFDQCDD